MILFFIEKSFPVARYKSAAEIFVILILLFALKRPSKEVLMCGDRDVNSLQLYHAYFSPKTTMSIFYRPDIELHAAIETMRRLIPPGSAFASIKRSDNERDGYAQSLVIAYELRGKYLGQTIEADSTFKGYLISWKEESGERVFDVDRGVKVFRR